MTSRESDFNAFGSPHEMNAHVSSNRFRNEQQIRGHDEDDSPPTRGLRTHVIGAGNQKMVIQAEQQRSEHRKRQENESGSFLPCPDEGHCEQRTDEHDHDHEDRSWWIESNTQFTVGDTVRNADQQVGNNDGGHVLS
jgi:hypothetical protein